MKSKLISATSITLVVSMLLSACDISISINPTAEPNPVNEPIDVPQNSPKPENQSTSPATQNIEPISEPSHDLYAGFTENSEIPFVILHNDGESVGLSLDNQSNISDVVWNSPTGETIVFNLDSSRRPNKAVVGDDIIYYTNYTNTTVDLIIIHPDGTQEYIRTKLSSHLNNKATNPNSPSYRFASYTTQDYLPKLQIWGYIDEGLFALEIAACVGAAAGLTTVALPALLALGAVCYGPLIEEWIREGKAQNMDVGALEAIQDISNIGGCALKTNIREAAKDCIDYIVGKMADAEESANQKIANSPRPQAAPTPPKCTDKYNQCP
jgi:hypothetical protein